MTPSSISKDQQFDNSRLVEYCSHLRKKYPLNNKILLVQAPQFLFESFNPDIAKKKGYYVYPPTGLQFLAKALSGRNLNVEILDINYILLKRVIDNPNYDFHAWLDILDEHLNEKSPSIVGVTSINVYKNVFEPDYPLTSILNRLRDREKHLILAGGSIAMNEYKNYLSRDLCHFIVDGEGENKINFLIHNIFSSDDSTQPVQGVYYKYNNKVVETCGQKDIVELEGNLIDLYDLIAIEDYHNAGSLNPYSRMVGQDKSFSTFQLVRGCRANCKFCGVHEFMGKGIRHFPAKDVLAEIEFLVKEKGIRHFDVLDDDFLVFKEPVVELLKGLVRLREEYNITWSSNNGLIASSITEELMGLMCDSGCVGFRIGVETGNPEMLKKMRKPASLASLKKVGAILNQFPDAFTGGNYIIGLLGEETFGEMMSTFRFASELDLDWASFAVFQYTSSATKKAENLRETEKKVSDFVPSKGSVKGEIEEIKGVISGPDVFDLPENQVPNPEQLKQIWFTFNLVVNFIRNKNLKTHGRADKFTSWVEAVKIAYPLNPYMSLFAGLGRTLLGDTKNARGHFDSAETILRESKYWRHRFAQFDLHEIINNLPDDADEATRALSNLRNKYETWI